MEQNDNAVMMVHTRAIVKEREVRGYSGLRTAGMVTLLQDNTQPTPTFTIS